MHFCQPLYLQYRKETRDLLKEEEQRLREEIEGLNKFQIVLNSQEINVKYKIELTMFDGKAVNAMTDTHSSQNCNVCKAKPSEVNNLELVRQKPLDPKALELGLSTLHCWIR